MQLRGCRPLQVPRRQQTRQATLLPNSIAIFPKIRWPPKGQLLYRRCKDGPKARRINNPVRSSHAIAGSPAGPEAKDHLHTLNFVALSEQRSKFAAGRTADRDGSVIFQLTDI